MNKGLFFAAAMAVSAATSAQAVTIGSMANTGTHGSYLYTSQREIFGQTFQAAGDTLNSAQIMFAGPLYGRIYLYEWDQAGRTRIGDRLFESDLISRVNNGWETLSIDFGNLDVDQGSQYFLAFSNIGDLPAPEGWPSGGVSFGGVPTEVDTSLNGTLYRIVGELAELPLDDALSMPQGDCCGGALGYRNEQLAMTITFDEEPGFVPEPASWMLMAGALSMIGAGMRQRRKAAVSAG